MEMMGSLNLTNQLRADGTFAYAQQRIAHSRHGLTMLAMHQLVPLLLDCLSMLSKDAVTRKLSTTCYLSCLEYCLRKMAIRETALQCLVAVSELPHTRIYPLRAKGGGNVS